MWHGGRRGEGAGGVRVFHAPPAARRRLVRGALVLWFGLHLGIGALGMAMTGKFSGFLVTFDPGAQVAVVVLVTALAPLDLRISHERLFLANLGVGPAEAALVALITVAVLEAGLRGLVGLAS